MHIAIIMPDHNPCNLSIGQHIEGVSAQDRCKLSILLHIGPLKAGQLKLQYQSAGPGFGWLMAVKPQF